ncbi:hypothetical protein BURPS1106B_0416 [Burkholderia pseudomallei 1106b]|uniref:Uncharacterized protein n=1 Tax=Burkholderia pseudomallei (strain 1106a) TaxID=357348 RepID=A3P5J8_BURP0|nr:hypothetical protein BURPS1106A_A1574 [Burkholderia pseudomallei 1106a]EEP51559.1 conserved hypothetical protein [Burkholderia pseudomallei MSHR346]EES23299.1 hypothetical protein BURPS1106B_0416 [Burkholderia pseudomallei 1106b]
MVKAIRIAARQAMNSYRIPMKTGSPNDSSIPRGPHFIRN